LIENSEVIQRGFSADLKHSKGSEKFEANSEGIK